MLYFIPAVHALTERKRAAGRLIAIRGGGHAFSQSVPRRVPGPGRPGTCDYDSGRGWLRGINRRCRSLGAVAYIQKRTLQDPAASNPFTTCQDVTPYHLVAKGLKLRKVK